MPPAYLIEVVVASQNSQIIQLEIDEAALRTLSNRARNQVVGCMHAHNELATLNRLLMFSMNFSENGELHDSAQSVQMWCLLQVLVGKLFETWNMLSARFLRAQPQDPAIASLSDDHKVSLKWLTDYFGDNPLKDNALRTIRDKAAFHYDKLNSSQALTRLATHENSIYLAQRPVNTVYYLGSALVFRTLFTMIADKADNQPVGSRGDRTQQGCQIATQEAAQANVHLHLVLYGLIQSLLEKALGEPLHMLSQVRIDIRDAPDPDTIRMPLFIDMGQPSPEPPLPQVILAKRQR